MMEDKYTAHPGRHVLYTDEPEIYEGNVLAVLHDVMPYHLQNRADMDYLLNYEAGVQPLVRKKEFRKDINIECVDNVANEIASFKQAYIWGPPAPLVQRGEKDEGQADEVLAIAMLNEQYELEGIRAEMLRLGRYVEICGVGNVFIDVRTRDYEDGLAYFSYNVLDPRRSFVVRSSYYPDQRPMLGVTYRTDDNGNRYFTAFTRCQRFEVVNLTQIVNGRPQEDWKHGNRSGEVNPLGMIPIVEYVRAFDRMGCFERQLSELDNLNVMVSDVTNDVDQNTQAIWFGIDIDFPRDDQGNYIKPKTNEWILAQSTERGSRPDAKPLAVDYDYKGMLDHILARRNLILQKCCIPRSGSGSGTGVALSDSTGWTSAEQDAEREQHIIDACKHDELRLVLKAISLSPHCPEDSPLRKLKAGDVVPKPQRQKTYELTVKANAFATLLSHGVYGKHAIDTVNLFSDPNQVWADSEELIRKYQDSLVTKAEAPSPLSIGEGGEGERRPDGDRIMADYSDQRGQSPRIDGPSRDTDSQGASSADTASGGE